MTIGLGEEMPRNIAECIDNAATGGVSAEQLWDAISALAGSDAQARGTWAITACGCGAS